MSSASITANEGTDKDLDPIVLTDKGTEYVCFTPSEARQVLADVKLAQWYETEREPELVTQRDEAQANATTEHGKRIEAENQAATEASRKRFWRTTSLSLAAVVVLLTGGLAIAL